jgi:hypothetical protein
VQKEKDRIIEALEDKVARLMQQNADQNRKLNE